MRHERTPDRDLVPEIALVEVRDRSCIEVEAIPVARPEVDRPRRRRGGLAARASPGREVLESVEDQGTVEMEIVAAEPVGLGSLRGGRHEGRVGVDHTRRGEETVVRDAPEAHPSVVTGNVLHQPVDGVVSVGALVDVRRALLPLAVGSHVDEFPFREEAPPNVLPGEDIGRAVEARPGEVAEGSIVVRSVMLDSVPRPVHQDGVSGARVFRHVDGGIETDAVAHRNPELEFLERGFRIGRLSRHRRGKRHPEDDRGP